MSINIGDNLSYLGAKPLDGRLKYDTMSEMAGMADNVLYEGCLAYCVGTGKTYQWKSTNAVDPTTGKWREFTSGGGTAEDPIEYVSQLPTSGIEDKIYGLAITGQISRTIDLINPVGTGLPTKQQAIDYFSQYFTVTDVDADNIEIGVPPDLVLSRQNWGSNDWVAGRDFNKLYYNVELAELNAYMDSTSFASTGAWGATSQYYIHCTSAYFPTYKYYAGVEDTQELNEIGGGSANIDNDTIVENQDGEISVSPAYKKIFNGTQEGWNALTTEEKKEYDNVSTPDPTSAEALVDVVENGNMNAVTSNAVYDTLALQNITPTRVNAASNSGVWVKRSGRVVNVNFAALVTLDQTTPSGTILYAGFPKPALDIVRFTLFDATTIDVASGFVQINTAGNLVADGQGLKTDTAYWGSFTYLTKE